MVILLVHDDWWLLRGFPWGLFNQCLEKQACRWRSNKSPDSFCLFHLIQTMSHFPVSCLRKNSYSIYYSTFPFLADFRPGFSIKHQPPQPPLSSDGGLLCGTSQTLMRRLATSDWDWRLGWRPGFGLTSPILTAPELTQVSFVFFPICFPDLFLYFLWVFFHISDGLRIKTLKHGHLTCQPCSNQVMKLNEIRFQLLCNYATPEALLKIMEGGNRCSPYRPARPKRSTVRGFLGSVHDCRVFWGTFRHTIIMIYRIL